MVHPQFLRKVTAFLSHTSGARCLKPYWEDPQKPILGLISTIVASPSFTRSSVTMFCNPPAKLPHGATAGGGPGIGLTCGFWTGRCTLSDHGQHDMFHGRQGSVADQPKRLGPAMKRGTEWIP